MDFKLNDEQKMLIHAVRSFVTKELLPLEDEIEEKGSLEPSKAKAIFQKSKSLGFYAMNIPEEFGGGGLSAVDTCLAEEQFGRTKDILIRRAFGTYTKLCSNVMSPNVNVGCCQQCAVNGLVPSRSQSRGQVRMTNRSKLVQLRMEMDGD